MRSVRFGLSVGPLTVIPERGLPGGGIGSVPYVATQAASEIDSLPVLLLDERGVIQDTLAWHGLGHVAVSVRLAREGAAAGGDRISFAHPFDLRGLISWDSQSRWAYVANWRAAEVGRRDEELELVRVSTLHDSTVTVRLPLGRSAVSERDVRTFVSELRQGLPEGVNSRLSTAQLTRTLLEQVPRPSQPEVDAMIAGADGTVWLREGMEARSSAPKRWFAYRFEQGIMGFVELPLGHTLLAAAGGLLWSWSKDSLDLPTIASWELEWAAGENQLGR